jgi:hypothetical protein
MTLLFSLLACTSSSLDSAPVARAGVDQRVELGNSVTLDGVESLDLDGEVVSYGWTVLDTPNNEALSVSSMESTVTFTPDALGDYTLALVVYDDDGARSAADVVTVTTFRTNTPPVAVVTYVDGLLDGGDSFDADGDPLSYAAEVVVAPTGALASITPSKDPAQFGFVPIASGTYVVGITVNDGDVDSTRADVVIFVEEAVVNEPPVADAGPDLLIELGGTVPLDGSGSSDPEGVALSALWTVSSAPAGAVAAPDNATELVTTFTPDIEGDYTLVLTVDDGVYVDTDEATVTASVKLINTPPIADAGPDIEICAASELTVDAGGSSDLDGDTLTYIWTLDSAPAASGLSSTDLAAGGSSATFTPDVVGDYTLTVTVDDGTNSDSDTLTVSVGQVGTSLLLHMDETTGTTLVDESPFANDSTASGGFFTGGRFFGAAGFDGAAEAVVPHDASLTLEQDFTLGWWMEVIETDANPRFIYTKGSGMGFAAYYTYEDLVLLLTDSTGVAYTLIASDVIFAGGWHHYALVVDGDAISLYSDGLLMSDMTAPSTSLAGNSEDLTFGSATGLLYPFEGALDEVVLHDTVLSAGEIFDRAVSDTQICTEAQDVTAPVISIDGPTDGSVLFVTTVTIEGSIADESAIVDVTLNGWPVDEEAFGYAEWSLTMPVLYGTNTFTVEATDIAGNVSTQSITVTYEDPICEPDAVLVWTFESDEGDDIFDSGSLLIDAVGTGLDWVATPHGNGLLFDGTKSAQTGSDSALTLSTMTVSFWLNMEDTGAGTQVILHNEGAVLADYGVAVSGTFVVLNLELASGASELVTVSGAVDGTWHHVTFTFDGDEMVGYVDGIASGFNALGTTTTIANVGDQLTLGAYGGVSSFFEGTLSQLRLFDFALTAVEVASRAGEGAVCDFRGSNFALDAVATASSEYGADYSAANAIDGDYTETLGSVWRPNAGSTGWLELDLGKPIFVSDLRWLNINNSAIGPDAATTDYSVELSTTGAFAGEQWLIASGTGELETTPAWHDIHLAVAIEVQYLRFHVDSYTGDGGGLTELQVFGFL